MTAKNLYDLLGVPSNATAEQIRQAYVLRSKMLHPDRFNQTRQSAEWELANEMLKELNYAYSVLRDSASRAQYDRTILGTASHQPPPQQRREPPPSPQSNVKVGPLKSGFGCFDSLTHSARQRLSERVAGTNKVQYAIKLHGIGGSYFWATVLIGLNVFLFFRASEGRLSANTLSLCITGVAALLQALNINWIIRWHTSPLRCWLLITPLYVIKTNLDRVWYWPICEVSDIKATHNYSSGVYQNTSLRLTFNSVSEEFSISPHAAYDSMLDALRAFEEKSRTAISQEDWAYFFEQDDFRECVSETTVPPPRRKPLRIASVFAISFVLFAVPFIVNSSVNRKQIQDSTDSYAPPKRTTSSYVPPRTTPYRPQMVQTQSPESQNRTTPDELDEFIARTFSEPEVPLPDSGKTVLATLSKPIAPFEIKSSYGTNYLVKLVDVNDEQSFITVFIRGGTTVNVDVPLGTYVVKYASGVKWYGYSYLFGPSTVYSKAAETYTFDLPSLQDWNARMLDAETQIFFFLTNNGLKPQLVQEIQDAGFDKWPQWNDLKAYIAKDPKIAAPFNKLISEREAIRATRPTKMKGCTITLYKVREGNLRAESIKPDDF